MWNLKRFGLIISGLAIALQSFGNQKIEGILKTDTSWNNVIYISIINDFGKINSMSNQMIIDKTEIDSLGRFRFATDYFPTNNHLYRIHISKTGDPPASLISGGKDENHMFFIANNSSEIFIEGKESETVFGNTIIRNSPQSQLLQKIDEMVLFVDTSNFHTSVLKRELMENALDEKLRQFADTCSFPLVALYAIYKSNFEDHLQSNPFYYVRFSDKWSAENSSYFAEFRKKIPLIAEDKNYSFIYGFLGLLLGLGLMFLIMKLPLKRSKSQLHELTLQERKIFQKLQQEKSNKEISEELNISLSTVKSHINNIFSKLKIKSRKEVSRFEIY